MKTIVTGHSGSPGQLNRRISAFIADRCGVPGARWIDYTTVGLLDNRELVAGVLYHEKTESNIVTHIATGSGRRCLNREFLWYIFHYPFIELGCIRITAFVRLDNYDSLRFCRHLGFDIEAVLKCTHGPNVHTCCLVMWKDKCRWLNRRKLYGQVSTCASAAA